MILSVPANYNLYHIKDDKNKTCNYVSVASSVYIRRQINAKMYISGQYRYSRIPPHANEFISGLILTDYRNMFLQSPISEYKTVHSVTLNLKYRNPMTSFFFNLTGKYEQSNNPFTSNQLFIDNYVLNTNSSIKNEGKNLIVNGSISKGLLSGRLTLGLDANHVRIQAKAMRQNQLFPYVLKSFSAQPNLKGFLTNWFSVDYRLAFSKNTMVMNLTERSSHNAIKQYLTFTFIPDKKWQTAISGEHYYTKFNSGNSSNMILFDASVRWDVSKCINVSLIATNILNQREYRYVNYGLLSETEYQYRLRGRNIEAKVQIRL